MTPDSGDTLFSRLLGDNLLIGTARMLGLAALATVILTVLVKIV